MKYYFQNLGLIIGSGSNNRYAFNIGQTGLKRSSKDGWDDFQQRYGREKKSTPLGISGGFIPEIVLDSDITLRGFISLAYTWDKPVYSYLDSEGSRYDVKEASLDCQAGLGLNYKYNPETIFSFTLNSTGYFNKEAYKEKHNLYDDSKTVSKNTQYDITAAIGLEKEIIPQLFTLRCSISPFKINYYYDTKEINGTKDVSWEETYFYGPIESYSLGIGYQPSANVMIDFDFSKISSSHSEEKTEYGQYSQSKAEDSYHSYSLNFSATFKF
jgi:hypothetical protein